MRFAEQYPKSTFVDCDLRTKALEKGQAKAEKLGWSNVVFELQDACALPDSWTGRFSHVTMVDTLHDLAFPLSGVKQVYRVLRPGGYFSVLDTLADSEPRLATKQWDGPVLYGYSLYHCMGLSLAVEGSEGLGTVAGIQKLTTIMETAGFSVERMKDTSEYCHLLGHKQEQ